MGTLKSFLEGKGITAAQVSNASRLVELHDAESRSQFAKRAGKRRVKENATKKYDELGLPKPKVLGRAVSLNQVNDALNEKEVPRKVRSKIHRAVNAILTKKGQPAAEFKALFEGTKHKAGPKPKTETKGS